MLHEGSTPANCGDEGSSHEPKQELCLPLQLAEISAQLVRSLGCVHRPRGQYQ